MAAWYYARSGQQLGPVDFERLAKLAADGQLALDDLVWCEGMVEWMPAGQVDGLFQYAPPRQANAQVPVPAYAPYPPGPLAYQAPYVAPSQYAGMALTGMILSLVSLVMCGPLLAIPGAICGWVALRGMKRTGDPRNRGFALTAVWVGIGEIALIAILVFVMVVAGAFKD